MEDFDGETHKLVKTNLIPAKRLRSYTGRANHIANLLPAWRPFLDYLWTAVSSVSTPYGTIRQVRRSRAGFAKPEVD